jgi:hypothetical protein
VHRATFCNHFISAGEAAYAISIGFKEFQLLDYGDRHLGADPAEVARSWATSPNIGIGDSTRAVEPGPGQGTEFSRFAACQLTASCTGPRLRPGSRHRTEPVLYR